MQRKQEGTRENPCPLFIITGKEIFLITGKAFSYRGTEYLWIGRQGRGAQATVLLRHRRK